jgi:hypothetical protein
VQRPTRATSRRRAGRAVSRRLRAEAWSAARRSWKAILGVALLELAAAAVVVIGLWGLEVPQLVLGFVVGVFVGSVPLLVQAFLAGQGLTNRSLGAEAERWTAGELRKLDRRRWRVFHDVPLRYGNVDHVVIGHGRVYAVETKWTSSRGGFLERSVQQCARRAEALEQLLRLHGVERNVIPLLVLWGPGLSEALGEGPTMGDSDVRIVQGKLGPTWRARMEVAADADALDEGAVVVLRQLAEEVWTAAA